MAAETTTQEVAIAAEPNRLQKLPAELRNRIYELALPRSEVVHAAYRSAEYVEPRVKQPALTRTCKQIRAEALPLFYGAVRVGLAT
ncbi:hypothetical protein LTR37_008418 [Vermiconidia calcicola]|uniref:Uncharacterized protein n=1 Tax=Vermiconidia calcicola TaxID=1690605 RepID=A0ACC3NC65_9PEZI|nr:hypothetical protein LTR37_008418 [Vermiconidia calcicola]